MSLICKHVPSEEELSFVALDLKMNTKTDHAVYNYQLIPCGT